MALEIFGIVGLLLILAGWLHETAGTIRKGKCELHSALVIFYFGGSALLTAHSLIISDLVFIILNGVATLIALINLYYIYKRRRR